MAQALYRKYRPRSFKELVGQNPIRVTLENEVDKGQIAHAYLFTGPRGVGKTTTARLLATAANCTKRKDAEPCGSCDSCKRIREGKSLDLIEIDAASHTGVDNVRENIIENARFTPQQSAYKVFIIDEVHMLSTSAFNALLKTLEEPPEHVIFILATTEVHRVPETIISRCQRFDFKRVSVDELVKRLSGIVKAEKVTLEDGILKNIARRAEGSVRDAEVLLGQILSIGGKHITLEEASLVLPRSNIQLQLELFDALAQNNAADGLNLVNRLMDEGINIQSFTKDFVDFIRILLVVKVGGNTGAIDQFEFSNEQTNHVKQLISSMDTRSLVRIIETVLEKSRSAYNTPILQLPLELAVLELCESDTSSESEPKQDPPPPAVQSSSSPKPSQKTPEKETPEKKPTDIKDQKTTPSSVKVTLDQVLGAWESILKTVQEENHSLGLSLNVGIPFEMRGNKLIVGFRHAFHADRVNQRETRSAIEDAIQKELKVSVTVSVSTLSDKEYEKAVSSLNAKSPEGAAVDQALEFFGGEVVEEE